MPQSMTLVEGHALEMPSRETIIVKPYPSHSFILSVKLLLEIKTIASILRFKSSASF